MIMQSTRQSLTLSALLQNALISYHFLETVQLLNSRKCQTYVKKDILIEGHLSTKDSRQTALYMYNLYLH